MKKKNNKTCVCCGTQYTYCNRCNEYINEPAWKNIFHDENCKDVFHIVSDYNGKALDKNAAITNLKNCNLTVNFNESIKKIINELVGTDKKTEETKTEKSVRKNKENKNSESDFV